MVRATPSVWVSPTKRKDLCGPQLIKLDGKTYDFQETSQNYHLVDPNSDFILIMPADQHATR
jgi:hypothetical protein